MDTQIGTRPLSYYTACKSTDLFIAAPVDDMQQLVSFTETEIRVMP